MRNADSSVVQGKPVKHQALGAEYGGTRDCERARSSGLQWIPSASSFRKTSSGSRCPERPSAGNEPRGTATQCLSAMRGIPPQEDGEFDLITYIFSRCANYNCKPNFAVVRVCVLGVFRNGLLPILNRARSVPDGRYRMRFRVPVDSQSGLACFGLIFNSTVSSIGRASDS